MTNGYSLILPIFNEEKCILNELKRCLNSLEKSNKDFEIIIIDDCSTDNSYEIADNFINESKINNIQLFKNFKNIGVGYGRKRGSEIAKYKNIIWTDVDMTYPNDKIHELIQFYEESNVDMSVGNRLKEMGTFKLLRYPTKLLIRKLAEFLAKEKIPDLNSGFRIFNKEIAKKFFKFLPNGFSCVSTLSLAFLTNNKNVNYFDIEYKNRVGVSKFKFFSDTTKYIRQIIVMCTTFNPLRFYLTLFVFFLVPSIMLSIFGLYTSFTIPNSAVILFFISFIFLIIGALAESISNIYKD
jgi:glycosyltransferase involved in cell wall biosynthesis